MRPRTNKNIKSKEVKKEDSSSLSSSDSDSNGKSSQKKKGKNKGSLLIPCLNVPKRFSSCLRRWNAGLPCLTPTNSMCFLTYGVILLLPIFLYYYGATIVSFLRSLSLFKSTNTIVNEALAKYSADKLAMPDYALESAGGSILCSSETYYSRSGALYSIFGVPLWYHASSPREVIQPDVLPGKCWAMDGDKGYVMVKLSMPVIVTAISLEHISARVAPTGRISSAPKEFTIIGKEHNMESTDILLGSFVYDAEHGPAIQTFEIKDPYCVRQSSYSSCGPNKQVFHIIELRILNNYGNSEYTCIYRLRVHGNPLGF